MSKKVYKYPKVGLYISQNNKAVADAVLQYISDNKENLSDWVWEACALRLAQIDKLPLAEALRPILDEKFEEYLSHLTLMPGQNNTPKKKKEDETFFNEIVESL